jgi:hypothetical protein
MIGGRTVGVDRFDIIAVGGVAWSAAGAMETSVSSPVTDNARMHISRSFRRIFSRFRLRNRFAGHAGPVEGWGRKSMRDNDSMISHVI